MAKRVETVMVSQYVRTSHSTAYKKKKKLRVIRGGWSTQADEANDKGGGMEAGLSWLGMK